MANTYKLIASTTVGAGGAANITFSSISSAYTDLKLVWSVRAGADTAVAISFNGVTTNLSRRTLFGDGSAASSVTGSNLYILGGEGRSDWTANTFGNAEIYIPNYTSSNNKSASADAANENNATTAYMSLTAGLWSSSAAITSVTITPNAGTFEQYSSAYLYGIKNS